MSYSSTISPTSSSRQSSRVIRPAILPYSSATTARWNFFACISRINRFTGLFSGITTAARICPVTTALPKPARSCFMRSLIKAIPTTSSSSARTGKRDTPCSMATSIACVRVNELDTVIMSGKGTITSRATVSPNSMIDSIRSRSSSSMMSS